MKRNGVITSYSIHYTKLYEAALAELHRAYPSLSQTIGINFNMGLAYTRLHDPDSALLYLEQAETGGALEQPEIYPLASAFYNVALVYLDDGNQDAAIETLEIRYRGRNIHEVLQMTSYNFV